MTRNFVFLAALALVLSLAATGSQAATWVPLNGIQAQEEAPRADLIRCDFNEIQINFSLSGFSHELLTTKGGNFSRLLIGDEGYTTEIGQPQLPVIRKLIEIPYGAKAELVIGPMTARRGTLAEFGITNRIIPVQAPIQKTPGAREAAPFALDEAAYAQDGYAIGQFARMGDEGYLRGHRFVLLEVYPIDYNPATGELLVVSDIQIQIHLSGSNAELTRAMKARYADPYVEALAQRIFFNPHAYREIDLIPPPLGLLIITNPHNAGLQVVQDFVAWKEQKGFHTTVATTQQTGTTNTQIKAYIQNAYNNWPIPPNFVLLLGDTDVIPYWPAGGPGTDLYYATLEGTDYFNDVGIGRLSPSNDGNLANMINKTLEYEQAGWTGNDDWEKWGVFMASNDNWGISEGTHNYVIDHYLTPDGYRATKLYCHTYGATTQQITENVNAGRSLAIYSGHGDVGYWADGPVFTQANIQALVNTVFPLVTSHACLTGQFMAAECFGETWIRVPHGTMAFWGSADYTYWDEDDFLEKGMFEGFFDEQSPQEDQNLTWIAGMTDYGKYYVWQQYGGGGMSMSYWEQYNLLGDPTVDIWTDVPQDLTATFPSAILIGQNSLTVTVSGYPDWAMVNVFSDAEEAQFTGYVATNGSITFNLGAGFTVPGTMHVWVTGHDCRPYHGTAAIIPPSGPYVVFDSLVVNDSPLGNGNGQLDYGETSELTIYAKNVGVAPANNVTLNITSQDTLLTVIDGTEFLGTLAPGAVAHTNRGFTVRASSQLPDGHALPCLMTAVSGTSNWISNFAIPGHAPVVEFDSLIVHDDTGNQNGCLDPGETANLQIYLKNNGSSPVSNVSISVFCDDIYITIYSGTAAIGTLTPGQTGSGTIAVAASATCPWSYPVRFDMFIFGGNGYTAADDFTTIVGDPLYQATGPDGYGYSAYDPYDAPETPDYSWVEISADSGGSGTQIPFTTDDGVFSYPLPFGFRYYGAQFDTFTVGANGWMAMGRVGADDYSNSAIPNSDGPPNMIAAYWEDLSPQRTNSGKIWRWFDATNHRLIVEYNHIEQFAPTGAFETFQVILLDENYYPTSTNDGRIKVQYKDISGSFPTEGTVGIENGAQTVGLQYLFDGATDTHAHPITDGFAILYTTPASLPNVTITLTPSGTPIQIPVGGGNFNYNIAAANAGTSQVVADVWCMVTLPNGALYGPTLGPAALNMPAGFAINRNRTQTVPGSAPAGAYVYRGYIGDYPATIWDEDNFPFTKLTTGVGSWVESWLNSGESFDDWPGSNQAELPDAFALQQNYPNPFNPRTAISYQLSANSHVNLRIYDTAGRLVTTLVNGWREASRHQVTWDASGLPSGLYFCRMQAGAFTATQKMMLVK